MINSTNVHQSRDFILYNIYSKNETHISTYIIVADVLLKRYL